MLHALAFLGGLSPGEILIVVAVIVLLFGSQKIPQLMRSMGAGLSEFKKGIAEGQREAVEPKPKDPSEKSSPGDSGGPP